MGNSGDGLSLAFWCAVGMSGEVGETSWQQSGAEVSGGWAAARRRGGGVNVVGILAAARLQQADLDVSGAWQGRIGNREVSRSRCLTHCPLLGAWHFGRRALPRACRRWLPPSGLSRPPCQGGGVHVCAVKQRKGSAGAKRAVPSQTSALPVRTRQETTTVTTMIGLNANAIA